MPITRLTCHKKGGGGFWPIKIPSLLVNFFSEIESSQCMELVNIRSVHNVYNVDDIVCGKISGKFNKFNSIAKVLKW